jgi:hypothetical protein
MFKRKSLEEKMEKVLEYIYENYGSLCDPTSESATISPNAFYHEGLKCLFVDEIYGGTGDPKLKAITEDASFRAKLAGEMERARELKYIECVHCFSAIYDETAGLCPACHKNPRLED